ncbi:hypothetical protein [Vibrio crassostreae]|uniref:hypothetical protein n=1 Tax=Vibrio crassostreae TaxID=246167 RepID=UPI001B31653F|nr:hypothetical protein [Vibrio crassostreae]
MNWTKLKNEYISDFNATKVSLRDWCHKKDIKFNTARRHIKTQQLTKLQKPSSDNTNCASGELNTVRIQHKGYSKFIDEEYVNAASNIHSLQDELSLARSILAHQSDRLYSLSNQLDSDSPINATLTELKSLRPLYDLIDRSMGRVANLELSIAKLNQIKTGIARDEVQTKLLLQTIEQRSVSVAGSNISYYLDW